MAYSYVRYSGNGSTTNYTFSFPTISTDHIKVRVNGTLVTNWSFLNSSTIQFAAAPASGTVIEIRRETPKDSTIVNFTDGSVLLERDLDLLATWQLYLGQETEDDIEDTIRVDSQSRFDAQNRRIINVADPINAQDAVTKVYADAVIGQATAAASAAAAVQVALAADEAVDSAASALAAAASASSAGTSATNAASSASAAAASLDSFDDRYLGAKAVAPTVDNDGNALLVGATFWDSVSSQMFVWAGSQWKPTFLTGNAVRALIAATAGQTVFTVPTYVVAANTLQVFVNGVKVLIGSDYAETNQNTITFASGLTVGDEVEAIALQPYAIGTTGAESVSFQQSGTGSALRTVDAKLKEIVSVKDFGAVGDGVTNDAAAIQLAVNAATANQTVYFPAGTYAVGASGIAVTSKTGVTLLGDGATIKITAISTLTTSIGAVTILLSGCTRSGVRGLEINGNSIASSGVGLTGCTECFVDGVTVYSSGVNGQITSAGGGLRNKFTNNTVHSGRLPFARGLWLGNVNAVDMETDIYISGNTVRNNPASGIVVSSDGGRVIGNHCRTNEGSGIVIPGANGYSTKNLTVSGNFCVDNLFFGIQSDVVYSTDADLTANITVTGNVCNSNNRGSGGGIYCVNSQRWTVSNNVCNDNVSSGIQCDDRARNITVVGNTCTDTRSGGSRTQQNGIRCNAQAASNYGVVIADNTCSNNTASGINLTTVTPYTLTSVTISGNACYGNSGRGIFVAEAATGEISELVVSNNVCTSNTSQDLRLSVRDVAIGVNRCLTTQDVEFYDLASNSATPAVPGRMFWRANNSSATTITAFNSGGSGQQIIIRSQNGNTTIASGGLIVNKGNINVTIPGDGTISYVRQGTVWREIFRSF